MQIALFYSFKYTTPQMINSNLIAASLQASSNTNLGFWEPCVLYAMKNLDFVSLCLSVCHCAREQTVSMISVIDHRWVVTWCLRTYIGLRPYMVNVYIKE